MLIKIADAKSEIARLTCELAAVSETAKSHAQEIASLIAERDAVKADAVEAVATATATANVATEHLAAALSANAALETERASAVNKAVEIVAAIGFASSVAVAPDTTGDISAQLNAMPYGAARQQFLLKNWNKLNSR